MERFYRGFSILNEYPSEERLSDFTVFVWSKGNYFKSELYEKDCLGGYIGFGENLDSAVYSAVDSYWDDNSFYFGKEEILLTILKLHYSHYSLLLCLL